MTVEISVTHSVDTNPSAPQKPGTRYAFVYLQERDDVLMPVMKSINLRISSDLLDQIDQAAAASGQDRSNWLRHAATEKLNGGINTKDPNSAEEIKVADERAREIVRDVLVRLNRLEQAVFPSDNDPFAS